MNGNNTLLPLKVRPLSTHHAQGQSVFEGLQRRLGCAWAIAVGVLSVTLASCCVQRALLSTRTSLS